MRHFGAKLAFALTLGSALAFGTAATAVAADLATPASVLKKRSEMKPQYGGILKYVVPAEPPSFDGHRETTFALIHPIAPFSSLLILARKSTSLNSSNYFASRLPYSA